MASGQALSTAYHYKAFGEQLSQAIPFEMYGYTSREADESSNLYFYRARWCDPAVGRFMSKDPLGPEAGSNQYLYVGNNPMNRVDPSGLYAGPIIDGGGRTCLVGCDYSYRYNKCMSSYYPDVPCRDPTLPPQPPTPPPCNPPPDRNIHQNPIPAGRKAIDEAIRICNMLGCPVKQCVVLKGDCAVKPDCTRCLMTDQTTIDVICACTPQPGFLVVVSGGDAGLHDNYWLR